MTPPALWSPRSLAALATSMAVCFTAFTLGGTLTAASVRSWYQTLARPPLTAPDWAFPVVWSILFLLMAVAAWLVWRATTGRTRRIALGLFALQLALNVAWSGLFFGLQRIDLALAEIVLLWLAIAATIRAFAPASRTAAWLLAPYLAWVSFATYLNLAIWLLNRS